MHKYLLFIFLFLSLQIGAQSNIYQNEYVNLIGDKKFEIPVGPSFVGIDPDLKQRLDQVIDDFFELHNLIGLSVALNIPNDDIYTYVGGVSDANTDLTINHTLAVGSISKTLTSAMILMLIEQDKLGLHDTIGQWINQQYIDPKITIKQLLGMTSGIYNVTNNIQFAGQVFMDVSRIWKPQEVLDLLLLEPTFEKGTSWEYSNTNYLILGMIIEAISGKNYNDIVHSQLLDPNGLSNIQLPPYENLSNELADLWMNLTGNNPINVTKSWGSTNALFSTAWAAGAWVSTPSNITKWAKLLYKGEILNNESMVNMLTPYDANTTTSYGLGTQITTTDSGLKIYGHNGEIVYSSSMLYIPTSDLSLCISTNDGTTNGDMIGELTPLILRAYYDHLSNVEHTGRNPISLDIYPNPSTDKLTLHFNKKINNLKSCTFVNVLGQIVKTVSVPNAYSGDLIVDISMLRQGSYQVVIETESEISSRIMIVK